MNDVKADAKAIFLQALDCKGADELMRFLEQACGDFMFCVGSINVQPSMLVSLKTGLTNVHFENLQRIHSARLSTVSAKRHS